MEREHTQLINEICTVIQDQIEEPPTLDELGSRFHMSPTYLQRIFKKEMGISPKQYADECRMQRFKESLRLGDRITDAIYDAGYGSSSRVYERSDAQLGMTPSAYQQGGKGLVIHYSIAECSLGKLLVAASERGICMIMMGDDESELHNGILNEFPLAEIVYDVEHPGDWVNVILEYLQGWRPNLDLPLDIQATAFQRRVWQELQKIPYGETRSYGEIAAALGKPTASRAVGRACATNPAALVIPCHRVVTSDGKMGGYRWGVERKEQLLAMEQETRED